jgi:hypothetical protein
MSARNHYRAAAECCRLTGTRFARCVALEKQGLISLRLPVPDAGTPAQRSFEALIVSVLADALSGFQIGAAFGVVGICPDASYPSLRLHPAMASRVLWEMLPRYDDVYGGVRGVPGMRPEQRNGKIVLRDLLSEASVAISQPLDPRSMMHKLVPHEQPLWLEAGSGLHDSEAGDRAYRAIEGKSRRSRAQAAGRDWVLSRMLRRPGLVNRTCREHGWANTYTHGYDDLVIEWCCSENPGALARRLRMSGVTAWPRDPLLGEPEPEAPGPDTDLKLAGTQVVLRRGGCSGDSPRLSGRIAGRTEWYR